MVEFEKKEAQTSICKNQCQNEPPKFIIHDEYFYVYQNSVRCIPIVNVFLLAQNISNSLSLIQTKYLPGQL